MLRGLTGSKSIPAVGTLVLAAAVAYVGAGHEPRPSAGQRFMWDFRAAHTPLWVSPNAQVARTSDGLRVVPREEPASVSSGLLNLDASEYAAVRLRLSAPEASEGALWLVVTSPTETRREPRAFRLRGGGMSEEIVVPLGLSDMAQAAVREAVLVPSMALQQVTIASIAFEPHGGPAGAALNNLFSRFPGEVAAVAPFAINTLPPPLVADRSALTVLIPLVLLAGAIAALTGGSESGLLTTIRRGAWAVVGGVWVLAFGLAAYYQTVALRADLSRFGGLSRSQAYATIDTLPLWVDMLDVARSLPPRGSVDVVIGSDRPVVVGILSARAAYYLYPVVVRRPAPFTLHYFVQQRPTCGAVEPELVVLREGDRYCLFGGAR